MLNHECAMSHICVDPGIERGRRAELIRMEKTGQALRQLRLETEVTDQARNCIKCVRQGSFGFQTTRLRPLVKVLRAG